MAVATRKPIAARTTMVVGAILCWRTVVQVDFVWISASSTEGRQYRQARPIWLTLDDSCGDSGMPVPSLTEPFTITTPKWISTVDGPVVDAAAHMHDGGAWTG